MTSWTPRSLALLRIISALLFLEHGTMKLLHFPIAQPGAPDPLPTMLVAAAVLEIVLGVMLTIGAFVRVAAFVAAGEMAIAYFVGHAPGGFWPGVNGGAEAILYCFIFLHLSAAGGGAWSVDARRHAMAGQSQTPA